MEKNIGSCSCGAVEYRFVDEPLNSIFCYCRECQKTTGTDKWAGFWVPTEKFNFTKGIPKVFTRLGDSGKNVNINFCEDCGTTLCAEVTVANFYSVAASTLNDSNSFSPKMAIYTSSAPNWAILPEGIPKFDILPPGMGG